MDYDYMHSIVRLTLSIILMVLMMSAISKLLPILVEQAATISEQESTYATQVPNEELEEVKNITPTRAPTVTPVPTQAASIYIAGDVNTGDKYAITNESQKIDYSLTIIIVAAIIMIPTFIVVMTVLILKHKQSVREHTESVLRADLKTFEKQNLDELKEKYK